MTWTVQEPRFLFDMTGGDPSFNTILLQHNKCTSVSTTDETVFVCILLMGFTTYHRTIVYLIWWHFHEKMDLKCLIFSTWLLTWMASKDIITSQLILSFHSFLTEFHSQVLVHDVSFYVHGRLLQQLIASSFPP
jgi:hypothetical protein